MAKTSIRLPPLAHDLTGVVFGHLTAVRPTNIRYYSYMIWECVCVCGLTVKRTTVQLKKGYTTNCGCVDRRLDELRKMPEYQTWKNMRRRCSTEGHYTRYSGRGISICERWQDFSNFYADMGPRPSPQHSLDRINNDGNYEPSNCRWATWSQQLRNTSRSVHVTFNGISKPLLELAREYRINERALRCRLDNGWTIEQALTTPPHRKRPNHQNYLTFRGKTMCLADWAISTGFSTDAIYARLKMGWSAERALTTPVRKLKRRHPATS